MPKNAFLDVHAYPLDWSKLTVDKLPAALDEGLLLARNELKALETLPLDKVNYKSFIMGLEKFSDPLDHAWSIANHLSGVQDGKEIRKIMQDYLPKITMFYTSIALSKPLLERVMFFKKSKEAKKLDAIRKRQIDEIVLSFRLSGADLSPARKSKLMTLEQELAKTCEKFSKKVIDARNSYEKLFSKGAERTKLAGLPPSALVMAEASAKSKGKAGYRFTLQTPSFNAIITYADDPKLRREFTNSYRQIGRHEPYNTLPEIKKILTLRAQKARLLGFSNFAELVLEQRMLRPISQVRAFLNKLGKKIYPQALKEFKRRSAFKKSLGHLDPFESWDNAYYGEKLKEKEFSLNTEALKPYFRFENVLSGIFSLCEKIFGIRVRKIKGHKTWHKDVTYYEVSEKSTGRLIGGFYADFFPRNEKRGGAWHSDLVRPKPAPQKGLRPIVGVICGNFSPPSGNTPSLLTHDEAHTLFHEFGHLLHQLMTTVAIPSLSGTRVYYDFVELPSQLMENYTYSTRYLPTVARHYKTGKPLDLKTIQKIRASEKFMANLFWLRQLMFCFEDITLHTRTSPPADLDKELARTTGKFKLPYRTQPINGIRSFPHLFNDPVGYAAGYHSYLWSKVLECDAWGYFEKHGILSPKTGRHYRECILSKGNSEPPDVLFKKFMGRGPKLEAFLKRLKP